MKRMNHTGLSRRRFLAASASVAGLCTAGCLETLQQKKRPIPVGLQLYSVRSECAKDLPGTIAKVAAMGYQGVEFAGYYDYPAAELRKMLDDNGLVCCGTHTQWNTLQGDALPATIEFNQVLGNPYLIVPWLDPNTHKTAQAWLDTAKAFNDVAAKLKPHGMYVGYHNHSHEFTPVDGQVPWDLFFGNTVQDVIMQFDTGNAMHGGGEALPYLKRYPGRAVTIHIKEYSTSNPNALIGEGDIPWQELLTVCETIGGTKWYIIEEEKDAYPPLVGVEKSLRNFQQLRGLV